MNQAELDALYARTTFSEEESHPEWDGLKSELVDDIDDGEPFVHVYIPQCSYFGETLICMADSYENGGDDGLFIQELVKLYREGKLTVSQ